MEGKLPPRTDTACKKFSSLLQHTFNGSKDTQGHEGNERADKLAEQGKLTTTRQGTAAVIPGWEEQNTKPTQAVMVTTHARSGQTDILPKQLATEASLGSQTTLWSCWPGPEQQRPLAAQTLSKRNLAKRSAGKDRIKWIHDQLPSDPRAEQAPLWRTVRRQKQEGRKGQLVVNGQPVPWSSTHKAFRDHLQNKQWAPNRVADDIIEDVKQKRKLRPQSQDTQPFTIKELSEALNKLKKGRAPGLDHSPNELFVLLDDENLDMFSQHYNDTWTSGEVPKNWKEAIVVSIHKGKGADTDPANYRPVSLLNTIYKNLRFHATGPSSSRA